MKEAAPGRQRFCLLLTTAGSALLVLTTVFFAAAFIKAVSPAFSITDFKLPAGFLKTVSYTFETASLSLALSLFIGLPCAFFTARRNFTFRSFLLATASIPLCLPAVITALGYISAFGTNGFMTKFLALFFPAMEKSSFLYSLKGVVLVQGFYNFPLIMAGVSRIWSSLDGRPEECASILGAGKVRTFFYVTLPRLLPAVISSAVPVFIFCFFSFMIVLLFSPPGSSTMETAVFSLSRTKLDRSGAAVIALTETILALLFIALYTCSEKKFSAKKDSAGNCQEHELKKIRGLESIPAAFIFAVIMIFFFIPLASIIFDAFFEIRNSSVSFTLKYWKELFAMEGFLPSIKCTLILGFLTSLISTAAALTCALFLSERKIQGSFIKTLTLLPMAVSSVVLSQGFRYLAGTPGLFSLTAAQCALTWPFAFRVIYPAVAKVPEGVKESAAILSSRLQSVFFVTIPYCAKAIRSSLALCFALSAADAAIPLVISVRNFSPLSLFTYKLISGYRFSHAAAAGLVLAALCMTLYAAGQKRRSGNEVF